MEFQEFIRQRNRMMDSFGRKLGVCSGVHCSNCPFKGKDNTCNYEQSDERKAKKTEAIVQKWADEHPVQTNADKFKEVFGDIDLLAGTTTMGLTHDWWREEYTPPESV